MKTRNIAKDMQPKSEGIETAEMEAWRYFYLRARNYAKGKVRPHIEITSAGILCSVQGLDILAFNRVLGAGIERPISRDALQYAIEYYRERTVPRFFLPVAPALLNSSLHRELEMLGFSPYNRWAMLYRPSKDRTAGVIRSGIQVRAANPKDGPLFASLMTRSFDWPESMGALLSSMVGNPEFQIYFAELDGSAIASAVLHIQGRCGTMMLAGTLPGFRGLGAQSLLLNVRIRDAYAAGCMWLFSQTAEPNRQKPVQSYSNMLKAGFRLAYCRTNFIFEFK